MKINKIKYLSGPNLHSYKPTIWIELDLEDLEHKPSNMIPGFTHKLLTVLPSLKTHTCSKGYAGGFVERLEEGTWMGHILEHIALEIQHLAGIQVKRGKTITSETRPGIYYVTYDYREKESGIQAFYGAMEIVEAILEGKEHIDAEPLIAKTAQLYYENKLGPSTEAIYQAALARQIPVQRVGNDSFLRLGTGRKQKSVQATVSSQTSYLAVENACDKEMTKSLLEGAGLPVPGGVVIEKREELQAAGEQVGYPVVIKPVDGRQGKGVVTHLLNLEQLQSAYDYVTEEHKDYTQFIIERYYSGDDYRFLIVDGKLVAASLRLPPSITGDGVHTIRQLIEAENDNPLRGEDHEKPMTKIPLDLAECCLSKRNLSLEAIPAAGDTIRVIGNANLSTGGSAIDVTDQVHPSYSRLAVLAAQTIGLDIAGIDMISPDVTVPYEEGHAVILEVNAAPGIRMHLYPSEGNSRDAGGAIVDYLFKSREESAIPIVAVTGTNGKTTTARLAAHLLKQENRRIGLTHSDGVWIDDTCIDTGDCSGPGSARKILSHPEVDLAVLETARGGILREGLAFRHCDVGIVTNVAEDHLGLDGIETLEDLRKVKRLIPEVVLPGGTCILNADDEGCAAMAEHTDGKVVYFSLNAGNKLIQQTIQAGGTAWYADHDWLVCSSEGHTWRFLPIKDIPITINGFARHNIANALAALAAAHALGKSIAELRSSIITFFPDMKMNRGRFNLSVIDGRYVIADYAHNPAGVKAIYDTLSQMGVNRLITAASAAGDRPDEAIVEMGRLIAESSDLFVIKEDGNLRGRKPLEAAGLLREAALQSGMETSAIRIVPDEYKACHAAWLLTEPGDLLLVLHDNFDHVERFLTDISQPGAVEQAKSKTSTLFRHKVQRYRPAQGEERFLPTKRGV
ncbi:cyanophycin synthetase [Paenibacillus sp. J22TS3]|uniref:cyanophycin synthetase n=1 Tax=Paenibacillus sp. J22TS3 TaxID=2807192 RepID=UPI001B29268A|nr:cyanophycin synthetase [Paenibacillus sp. J22TS3]GIP23432.1 cyanophycin synthetase [Paenibacillus sp. J22TS3]